MYVFHTENYCISAQLFDSLSPSPTPRRSLSSSYAWRSRQTSSASSSSPSSGCFSLPAPTCGSSMSGTQVSPSFLRTLLCLCQPNGHFHLKGSQETHSCQVSPVPDSRGLITSLFFLAERGVCLPTVSLWILFVYIEAAIRFKDLKNFHVDLCRPFAAHW